MLVCAYLLPLHTGPRVQRASGIPCALFIFEGGSYLQTSGATCRENAKLYPPSLRAKRSNPLCRKEERKNGLLRFARNDEEGARFCSRRPVDSQWRLPDNLPKNTRLGDKSQSEQHGTKVG